MPEGRQMTQALRVASPDTDLARERVPWRVERAACVRGAPCANTRWEQSLIMSQPSVLVVLGWGKEQAGCCGSGDSSKHTSIPAQKKWALLAQGLRPLLVSNRWNLGSACHSNGESFLPKLLAHFFSLWYFALGHCLSSVLSEEFKEERKA